MRHHYVSKVSSKQFGHLLQQLIIYNMSETHLLCLWFVQQKEYVKQNHLVVNKLLLHGSLKPNTPSFDRKGSKNAENVDQGSVSNGGNTNYKNGSSQQTKPPIFELVANISNAKIEQNEMSYNLVCVSSTPARSSVVGPIVDDGTPYSESDVKELRYHLKSLVGSAVE